MVTFSNAENALAHHADDSRELIRDGITHGIRDMIVVCSGIHRGLYNAAEKSRSERVASSGENSTSPQSDLAKASRAVNLLQRLLPGDLQFALQMQVRAREEKWIRGRWAFSSAARRAECPRLTGAGQAGDESGAKLGGDQPYCAKVVLSKQWENRLPSHPHPDRPVGAPCVACHRRPCCSRGLFAIRRVYQKSDAGISPWCFPSGNNKDLCWSWQNG